MGFFMVILHRKASRNNAAPLVQQDASLTRPKHWRMAASYVEKASRFAAGTDCLPAPTCNLIQVNDAIGTVVDFCAQFLRLRKKGRE
jgi:hypothetical protein